MIIGLLLVFGGLAVGAAAGVIAGDASNIPMALGALIGFATDLGFQVKYMIAGQSIGKSLLNLVVMNALTKTPCGFGQTFGRDMIHYVIGLIPLLGTVAVFADALLVFHPSRRRLVDWAANTDVLLRKNPSPHF